jgi:hypothetical protein
MMGEVSLGRVEELPPGTALEYRPALAMGDPAVLFVDRVCHSSFVADRLDGVPGRGAVVPVFVVPGGHAPETCH